LQLRSSFHHVIADGYSIRRDEVPQVVDGQWRHVADARLVWEAGPVSPVKLYGSAAKGIILGLIVRDYVARLRGR
jgi:hypothetical protein